MSSQMKHLQRKLGRTEKQQRLLIPNIRSAWRTQKQACAKHEPLGKKTLLTSGAFLTFRRKPASRVKTNTAHTQPGRAFLTSARPKAFVLELTFPQLRKFSQISEELSVSWMRTVPTPASSRFGDGDEFYV